MGGRIRALVAGMVVVAGAVSPATTGHAVAGPRWGCGFAAVRDVLDVFDGQGNPVWIELTLAYFVGTRETLRFTVTCWLQRSRSFGIAEVPGSRHTCAGSFPQAAGWCANPILFEMYPSEHLWMCAHVEWTTSAADNRRSVDFDPYVSGVQCESANHAEHLVYWGFDSTEG